MNLTGPFWRRFWLALIAVISGNVVYLSLQRFLPARGQHLPFRIDLGLLADFWLCALIFIILLALFGTRH